MIVNGVERGLSPGPERSLLEVLREELGLTGAKPGCGEGACGACTVLLDGEPVRACVVPAAEAASRSIVTVEGLARDGRLHPVQRAFAELGALQCGYCTPGMVVAAAALLARNPDPDEAEIRAALDGNVCRCCAYPRIVRAVRHAAELMRTSAGWAWAAPAGPAGSPLVGEPRAAPWDLLAVEERDYFGVLPDGVVVVLPPQPPQPGAWAEDGGAWLHVGVDRLVTAFTGKVDVGQGNSFSLARIVTEELRVPPESVRLVMGDTDVCPFDVGTFGSRSTVDAGTALRRLAAATRRLLDAEPEDVRPGSRRVVTVLGQQAVEPRREAPASVVPSRAAVEAVTGARRYASDLARPGMLHGRALRPPAVGATLRAADIGKAVAVPGATVVHDGPFVGVAAPEPGTAARALAAVEAEWEVAPQPSEQGLEQHLRTHPVDVEGWAGAYHDEVGDVDGELAGAPVRLTRTYRAAYIAHAPLETRAALAEWRDERLTVWTGTQQPFGLRGEIAAALGVAEEQVRVVVPPTGAGFGGKHTAETAVEAARLARATGRPVKLRWSREEEFTCGYFRPAAVIDVAAGAGPDGRLTAWRFENVNSGAAAILTPYDVPKWRVDFQPADSPLPQGPYRALAAVANTFARESFMDELAHEFRADPLEFRLRHLSDDRLAAVFGAVAERAGWEQRPRGHGRGFGIAGGVEKGGRVAACADVRVGEDRRLEILRIVTAFECGAIVDPDNLENQVEGATVMGLGGALFEAIHFDAGRILNASFSQYRVPRFHDVPPIEVVLLDRRDLPSAGAGETPIVAVAPALANAIFAATGTRLRSLPLVPEGTVP